MDNRHFMASVSWLSCDGMFHAFLALFPGLLQLQVLIVCSIQKKGRRPGESYHVIQGVADIMDSRYNSLFTFLLTASKNIREPKYVPEDKSYLWTHLVSKLNCWGMAVIISGATPNSAVFLLLVTQQLFGVMAFSLGMFHMLSVALCWCLSQLCS